MTTSALQHAGPHLTLFETRSLASRAMLCLYIFWASQSYERVAHDADNWVIAFKSWDRGKRNEVVSVLLAEQTLEALRRRI
jgi:hypothetical protein